MRVFSIWKTVEEMVALSGKETRLSCFGGSNSSETDALADARRRLEGVKRRIAGLEKRKGADYEADIREEPLRWLGSEDVVTRNRYGAEVLNSRSCVFVDVDEPVVPFWRIFRRFRSRNEKKEAILAFLRKQLGRTRPEGMGVRIYETHAGMRVLLHGRPVDPRGPEAATLFEQLHADPLYALLCRRQNCYRARLTPKPHRIKVRRIRLRYPYEAWELQPLGEWAAEYEARSEGHATCRLVEEIGRAPVSAVVRYHDERTRAGSRFPLA